MQLALASDDEEKEKVPHILFVTPYYPPEITPPAMRIHEMALRLVRLGHQVTVLTTFPNFPSGVVPLAYRGHRQLREQKDGITIVRVWSYISPNRGFLRRILAQLSFGCVAPFLGGSAVGQPDVIIVESPPLFNAIAGRLLASWKRCPFIFTVADLWPEVAVKMGMLRNRLLIRLAEWLEWTTYQRAALVWVVTEGLRAILLQRGLAASHIFVVTNGVDCTTFCPSVKALARAELAWDNRFTVLYAGSHGPSHGLGAIIDTAERLHACKDIRIILVGDGAEKEALMADAQRRGLSNITFLDPQPYERIPLLLAASDACLATASKAILFQGVLPVKMYEAMACARPIILAVDGEACRVAIQEAGAAIYAEPENPAAIADAILYLHEHPFEAEVLGQRGRAFVEQHFDRNQLVKKLHQQIMTVLHRNDTTPYHEWLADSAPFQLPETEPLSSACGSRDRGSAI
ncbi:glycosyltransferase family 4 protein [Dictyobacter arantiisoli]|nr:glycosyltransferase family 4 protein [Dictyobacter arantiisoli]